jgi:hypothetical protein
MPETGMPKSKEKTKNHPSFILSIKSSRQVAKKKGELDKQTIALSF